MNQTDPDIAETDGAETDGLTIFDDVRSVPDEPAAVVGLQLVGIVLTYAVIIGVVVLVGVVAVLAGTLLWPMLMDPPAFSSASG